MGLLPCLRRGSERWWLPRSAVATEALGHVLLATGRGRIQSHQIDQRLRQIVMSAISRDPPLLIYAALGWPGDRAEPHELAQWLIQNTARRFASGDAFLGAPPIDDVIRRRWRKLRDHYQTLPFDRWLTDASLWLEVTGPAVSESVRRWFDTWISRPRTS